MFRTKEEELAAQAAYRQAAFDALFLARVAHLRGDTAALKHLLAKASDCAFFSFLF